VLAEAGILFTILAPHQVESPSEIGLPLRFRAGKGREIALCAYDEVLAGDIAFGRLTHRRRSARETASRPSELR
jgi:hypothetical protein